MGFSLRSPERLILAAVALLAVTVCGAQGFMGRRIQQNEPPPTEFVAARWHFGTNGMIGHMGWSHNYPQSDQHLNEFLGRVTRVDVETGSYRIVELGSEEVFDYPFAYVSEPGEMELTDQEVVNLREFVGRGGFILMDDFDGTAQWEQMRSQVRRAFPGTDFEALSIDHRVFRTYAVLETFDDMAAHVPGGSITYYGLFTEDRPARDPRRPQQRSRQFLGLVRRRQHAAQACDRCVSSRHQCSAVFDDALSGSRSVSTVGYLRQYQARCTTQRQRPFRWVFGSERRMQFEHRRISARERDADAMPRAEHPCGGLQVEFIAAGTAASERVGNVVDLVVAMPGKLRPHRDHAARHAHDVLGGLRADVVQPQHAFGDEQRATVGCHVLQIGEEITVGLGRRQLHGEQGMSRDFDVARERLRS